MTRSGSPLLAGLVAAVVACSPGASEHAELVERFRVVSAEAAAEAERRGSFAVVGLDGWLFFAPELHHISVGTFWGDQASGVSRARDPADTDPLPAILDFKQQLDAIGVELLLVPVPPKSVIYPEKISDAAEIPIPVPRLDPRHQVFYDLLRERGVEVLDLTSGFLDGRFHPEGPVYAQQDTHWSGVGSMLAGQAVADVIRARVWYEDVARTTYTPSWYTMTVSGDLYRELDDPGLPREELRLRGIAVMGDRGWQDVEPDPASPIVLLGDSHNLVFHAGDDMHATGAGLADQLAFELGVPVDLIAVRGAGATPARVNLLRRVQRDGSYWASKRIVVWCFAAREFTESDGWALVPVVPAQMP